MEWKFNQNKIHQLLSKDYHLNSILSNNNKQQFICPYDNIVLYSDRIVTKEFWNLVKPAVYKSGIQNKDMRYRYFLSHELFIVQWGKIYHHLPNTIIKINPNKNNLSPSQLLDIIAYIVGDYSDVVVASWDEKVDITSYTSKQVAERLFVGFQRKSPKNRKNQNKTFYYGKRNGQQVKVYDKAKQLKLKNTTLVRIEKTHKVSKSKRVYIKDFLLLKRDDEFNNMTMVDIDKIDGRSKYKRLIKSEGTMVGAFKKMTRRQQQNLKQHDAFINPCLNIKDLLERDLKEWLSTSPLLRLKVLMDALKEYVSIKKTLYKSVKLDVHLMPLNIKTKVFPKEAWSINDREDYKESNFSIPLPF